MPLNTTSKVVHKTECTQSISLLDEQRHNIYHSKNSLCKVKRLHHRQRWALFK